MPSIPKIFAFLQQKIIQISMYRSQYILDYDCKSIQCISFDPHSYSTSVLNIRIIQISMRRELLLDDYSPPTLSYNISSQGDGGRISKATFTDEFKLKDMKVETTIRNSEKNDQSLQVSPAVIQREVEEDMQKSAIHQPLVQPELELTEELMKRTQRFLRKVAPLVEKELDENLPLYERFGGESGEQTFKRESRLVHTLQNQQAGEDKLEIAAVSWNASGVVVAAGYSKFDHDTTCSHKSVVCLWGIFKRNFKPTRPETIPVPNCVNCLSFHPKKPSVFAVGTYIGEVLLYDFSRKEEPLLGKSIVDDYFHKDCITRISWWAYRPPGRPETNHNLLSLGSDGKILLWEVPNAALTEQGKSKNLMKFPIKGFLMLRKKENVVIPVSGLSMGQSPLNRNIFIVGSEGGSILRATLVPINHHTNTQAKIMLDMQTAVKFKPQVYPFLLNLFPKNLREIKAHVEKVCQASKVDQVDSIATILNTRPELRNLYPNPITFAYEALSYPISSISYNRHGLFIANGGEGYSRIYAEDERQHLQGIEQGWEWGWINGGSRMGGFVEQQFVVLDWASGEVVWSIGVGQGLAWQQSSLGMVAVICDRTRVRVLQLGDKILQQGSAHRQRVTARIQELLSKDK